LKSAGAENSGVIDRVQLKEAIIANQEKMNVIVEENLPKTNAVVDQVMDTLNSTISGTIQKREFKKALLAFNDENQCELDVDSIVHQVFKDKVSLDRATIRSNMNQNPVIQETAADEPIVNDVLKQLESSSSGELTKSEVTKAIKDAVKNNNVVLTAPELSATVQQIFDQ
jgi:Ca2+-binding EF-hand superfamily protein